MGEERFDRNRNLDTSTIFANTVADLLEEDKNGELPNTWDCFEVEVCPPRKSSVLEIID